MSLLEVICLVGLAYSPSATRPSLRPAVSAHTTLTAIASPPEPPRPEVDLPTPTEEGGQLASLLPLWLAPQHTPSPSVRGPALSQCEWLA